MGEGEQIIMKQIEDQRRSKEELSSSMISVVVDSATSGKVLNLSAPLKKPSKSL